MKKKLLKSIYYLLVLSLIPGFSFAQDQTNIHIIFDASAGMSEEIEGRQKIDLARAFIEDLFNAGINVNFGLTVYGSEIESGDNAFYSPVPPSGAASEAILEEIMGLSPAGKSPIASALQDAGSSLDGDHHNYILLITNGIEDCGGGPVNALIDIFSRGIFDRLDIVGFEQSSQSNPLISEMVFTSAGNYFPVQNAGQLIIEYKQLTSIITSSRQNGMIGYRCFIKQENTFPAYGTIAELYNSSGEKIQEKSFWRGVFEDVVPGKYTIEVKNSGMSHRSEIQVYPDELSEKNFVFDFETGGLKYSNLIKNTDTGKAFGTITRVYHETGEIVYTGTSWTGEIHNLPEGTYKIEGVYEGLMPQEREIGIIAGTLPELVFEYDVGKGRIGFKCFLDSALQRVANGTTVRIVRLPYNETAAQLNQWRGTTTNLPIGPYEVQGNYKGIIRMQEVTIFPDSTSELNFVFNINQVRLNYRCFRNQASMAPANGVNLSILNQAGQTVEQSNRWRGSFVLPEGIYTIQANLQGRTIRKTINLFASAGTVRDEDVFFDQN
ncbi:MAG: hypothetical protein GY863_00920 [bacterium]|nr:hypothetical protein [bacterium]